MSGYWELKDGLGQTVAFPTNPNDAELTRGHVAINVLGMPAQIFSQYLDTWSKARPGAGKCYVRNATLEDLEDLRFGAWYILEWKQEQEAEDEAEDETLTMINGVRPGT